MSFVAAFIVLSFLGVIDTGYLFYQHYQKKPLVCPLDHPCEIVTESRWSTILGVRNETLGLIFYVGLFSTIVASVIWPGVASTLYLLLLTGTGGGFLYSLFLVYLQSFVIKNYCLYCLISAALALLLFLNNLVLVFG
jgi:uncharacterized membrane protein